MKSRRLQMESLESRHLLAGNVNVSIVNGEVRVVGDGAANAVDIVQIQNGFRVQGRPFNGAFAPDGSPLPGSAPTLINGVDRPAFRVAAQGKLSVNMNAGNDAVVLLEGGAPFNARRAVINTGAGIDFVGGARFGIEESLIVRTGLETETDADVIDLGHEFGVNFSSAADIVFATGGGNDRVSLTGYRVTNTFNVNLGGGADTFTAGDFSSANRLVINAGTSAHRDVINLESVNLVSLNVSLGGGNDLLFLVENVIVEELARVNGGAGVDEIRHNRNSIAREQETLHIEIGDWPFPPNG